MASKGHGSGLIELSQASSFRSREFSLGDRLSALRARTNKLTGLEDGARSRSELEAVAEASLKETGSHGSITVNFHRTVYELLIGSRFILVHLWRFYRGSQVFPLRHSREQTYEVC